MAKNEMKWKPSELPEDTVIDDEKHGLWMKEESGIWGQMVPHCIDCAKTVSDDYDIDRNATSDEIFTDFKIIALPVAVSEKLAKDVASYEEVEWHTDANRWGEILIDAIEVVRKEQTGVKLIDVSSKHPDLEWKVLDSFENYYIEVNEIGQFRVNDEVFNPEWDEENNQWVATVITEDGEEHPLDPEYFVRQQFNKDWQRG